VALPPASGPAGKAEAAPPDDTQHWVWLARIRHTQGRKGEVFADILTDFPEKFADRKQLWLLTDTSLRPAAPRQAELIHHWPHKDGIVLHFAGIDSITAAEALKGLTVAIPRSQRAPLAEDEVYIADLIGCTLFDVAPADPVPVGIIESVDTTAGPVALLVLEGPHDEVLIPFAKSYLRKIDIEAKRIEMALPEGLVELNAPGR
jgi:16S rRNA processing protein RimM